jgi:hypothetical protein
MQIICPCCQADFPIEAGINDVAARNAVKRAFSLTPLGDLLLGYVQLFKPEKRAMSMVKLVKLLDELLPMIQAGRIEHKGRIWPAPQEYWRMALAEMIGKRDTLTLPLKSHNYLFAIISGAADKAAKKQEEVQEMRKRTGRAQQEQNEATAKAMPEAVRNQLQQILNK